jgi:hypothetical protein
MVNLNRNREFIEVLDDGIYNPPNTPTIHPPKLIRQVGMYRIKNDLNDKILVETTAQKIKESNPSIGHKIIGFFDSIFWLSFGRWINKTKHKKYVDVLKTLS